jgi:hypothetical protein
MASQLEMHQDKVKENTMTQATQNHGSITSLGIKVLNTIRSQRNEMDYLHYGGLAYSTYSIMQELVRGDHLFKSISARSIFPYSSDTCAYFPGIEIIPTRTSGILKDKDDSTHKICLDKQENVYSIIANVYNRYSTDSDAKFYARAELRGKDGRKYFANFVVLEVYRKDSLVWEAGIYISTEVGNVEVIAHKEKTVLDVNNDSATRSALLKKITERIFSLPKIECPFNQAQSYFAPLYGEGITQMSRDEFNTIKPKRARYLAGSLDTKLKLKVENRYSDSGKCKNRINLVSNYLTQEKEGYGILIFENDNLFKSGPFITNIEAEEAFYIHANFYIKSLLASVNLPFSAFSPSSLENRMDYTYVTAVKDKEGTPIIISSLASRIDKTLPITAKNNCIHSLEFRVNGETPILQKEGTNFPTGVHPRRFMEDLVTALEKESLCEILKKDAFQKIIKSV